MVIHVGALLEGDTEYVRRDIAAVVDAVKQASVGSALVKVILETGFLDEPDILAGCAAAQAAGADFVKTSTGFGPRGASRRRRPRSCGRAVGESMGVKAAGGIRDLADRARHARCRRRPARHLGRRADPRRVRALRTGPA